MEKHMENPSFTNIEDCCVDYNTDNPSILANTSNLELKSETGIRYKPIPRDIYKECLEITAKNASNKYKLDLNISENELVFFNLELLNKHFSSDLNENVDHFIDEFKSNLKEILYSKLDKIGGYKMFNRSIIEFIDMFESNALTLTY